MLNGLDLFSGIGGISLALQDYIRPVGYCEIDPYCQGVLLSRMASGDLDNAPIWDDIKTLDGKQFKDRCDIIFGGFPCQDISVAGRGKGLEGERSGLFFEIVRVAKEIEPKFLFLENVPAITSRGGLQVVREIAEMGYDCRWCAISAASIGALHRRERWFLLAHAINDGASTYQNRGSVRERTTSREESGEPKESIGETERTSCLSSDVADTNSTIEQGLSSRKKKEISSVRVGGEYITIDEWQKTVSEMGKCSDGISFHVDRLRALGNSVVPQQVKEAFEILMGLK